MRQMAPPKNAQMATPNSPHKSTDATAVREAPGLCKPAQAGQLKSDQGPEIGS